MFFNSFDFKDAVEIQFEVQGDFAAGRCLAQIEHIVSEHKIVRGVGFFKLQVLDLFDGFVMRYKLTIHGYGVVQGDGFILKYLNKYYLLLQFLQDNLSNFNLFQQKVIEYLNQNKLPPDEKVVGYIPLTYRCEIY